MPVKVITLAGPLLSSFEARFLSAAKYGESPLKAGYVNMWLTWKEREMLTPPNVTLEANRKLQTVMERAVIDGGGVREMLEAAFRIIHLGAGMALFNPTISAESVSRGPNEEVVTIRVSVTVPNRDDAQPIVIGQSESMAMSRAELLRSPLIIVQRLVRDKLGSLLLHELDEGFTIDGRRVWDPHAGDKR